VIPLGSHVAFQGEFCEVQISMVKFNAYVVLFIARLTLNVTSRLMLILETVSGRLDEKKVYSREEMTLLLQQNFFLIKPELLWRPFRTLQQRYGLLQKLYLSP